VVTYLGEMKFDDLLLQSVLEILDGGPKTIDDIAQALSGSGGFSAENEDDLDDLFFTLQSTDLVWETVNGLHCRSDQMLDGVTLTHRLTQREIDLGVVTLIPDLDGLDLGLEEVSLVGGARLEEVYPTSEDDDFDGETGNAFLERSYSGPTGWLSTFSAGDLIAFHRAGEEIEVFATDQIENGEAEKAALSDRFDMLFTLNGDIGIEAVEVLLDGLCLSPGIFRQPVAPLQELLRDIGIEIVEGFLEPIEGQRHVSSQAWKADNLSELMDRYSLEVCCLEKFQMVLEALDFWRSGDVGQIDSLAVVKSLSHGAVAPVFMSWVFEFEAVPTSTIDEFMTHLTAVRRASAAAAYYLRSVARSLEGKALLAEKDIQTALQYDSKYEPARLEWALFAAARGDISTFISRLRQCESELADSHLKSAIEFLPKYPPTERNAPCPCGSGRKYKACCLVAPRLTPLDAQNWIFRRVIGWMTRPERNFRFMVYFEFLALQMGEADEESVTPLMVDAVVFEGGGFAQYLEMNRELLSEPDKELLESLVGSRRALFEVTSVIPGESITLSNFQSGETVTVIEHTGSLSCDVGDYRFGRVVDTREGPVWFGPGISIDLMKRQGALDLLESGCDIFGLLTWIARIFQPPGVRNLDGEDFVFCQARLRPSENLDLWSILGEAFEETEKDHWSESKVTSDEEIVSSASMRYDAGQLILDTNSVERLDQLLETLRDLLGDFEILGRSEIPVNSALENLGDDTDDYHDEMEFTPEVIQAFEAHMEELEDKWLDKSVPVLKGLTPREALANPKVRDDLLRLVNEMEQNEKAAHAVSGRRYGGFKASRIRSKLGL